MRTPSEETNTTALLPGDLLSELLPIVGEINSLLDPERLLPTIARLLRRIVDYSVLEIFLPAADGTLHLVLLEGDASRRTEHSVVQLGQGIVGAAAQKREPIFVEDVSNDPRYRAVARGVTSELAIPLVHRDHLVGVMNIEMVDDATLAPEALTALRLLASHLAVAIENATLYRESRKHAQRLQREMAIARRIQNGLLPEECPSGPGWEAAAHFLPAQELGGDLYDFYEIGDGLLGLAIGDVAGKGMPAALYAAFISGSVRARAFERREPHDLMARVNRTLRRRGVEGLFCTLAFALFDFKTRRVRMASSGLPYPLHYDAAKNRCEPVEIAGLPLGTFDASEYDERTIELGAGDVFVLYTDGAIEARNGAEEYGARRLKRLVETNAAMSAAQLGDTIAQDMDRFMGGRDPADDVTFVVVKVL